MKISTLVLFLIITLNTVIVLGQDHWGVGVSGVHNFPLSATGFGLRGQLPVGLKMAVVPQLRYFPKSNVINEFSAGVGFQYNILSPYKQKSHNKFVYKKNTPSIYATADVSYNQWINYVPSVNLKAKKHNILGNVGLGAAIGGSRIRLFLEGKYNVLWDETFAELGIMVFPKAFRKDKNMNCPKF